MKAVILAAGLGSRLDISHDRQPKALTKLSNGQSILQFQLEALTRHISIDDIYIVVGYHKEEIMQAYPDLTFIYNPDYEKENTAKSLLRALRKIEDDVLWLNGDVIFNPPILKKVIEGDKTSMVVNATAVGEEEVKYRTDDKGRILEVSKQVKNPRGEALGINFFKRDDLPLFKKNLEQCNLRDYFEKGIELGIQQGQSVESVLVPTTDCAEIDFPEDLQKANKLMQEWSKS